MAVSDLYDISQAKWVQGYKVEETTEHLAFDQFWGAMCNESRTRNVCFQFPHMYDEVSVYF